MEVLIANFGKQNWAWQNCLARPALAVMDDERVHPYWQKGDKEGYIREAQRVLRLGSGSSVTKPVASRWFNLNSILMETTDDLWIHREKDDLWWTRSIDTVPDVELIEDPHSQRGTSTKIYVYYKRCADWKNQSQLGQVLNWRGLHPRAKDFLFTEGTFQRLSADNANYAKALIHGDDLSSWHNRADWRIKVEKSKHGPVTTFDARAKTIARMAMTAIQTALRSGTTSVAIAKTKEFQFRDQSEMEKYLGELLNEQEGLCALTGLPLLLDNAEADPDFRCSLDRKDSNRHYERTNLQIVCRFANRWKGATDNDGFIRLIEIIREGDQAF